MTREKLDIRLLVDRVRWTVDSPFRTFYKEPSKATAARRIF